MLTLWDWQREKILLRSKAFSQDVFAVAYSPNDAGRLLTSGSGHAKFWRMSGTFTGLKLQGQLGKFGGTELTDIAASCELPDGKVLSGTEAGHLLLWDGGLIKCEIMARGRKPMHTGMIEVCFLEEGELITAGADGVIRVWDVEQMDNMEAQAAAGKCRTRYGT